MAVAGVAVAADPVAPATDMARAKEKGAVAAAEGVRTVVRTVEEWVALAEVSASGYG